MKDLKYVTLQSYQLHSLSGGMVEVKQELCGQRGVPNVICFCSMFYLLFRISSSHSAPAATDTQLIPVATKTLGANKVMSGEVSSAIIISRYLLTNEEPEARGSLILL